MTVIVNLEQYPLGDKYPKIKKLNNYVCKDKR